MPRSILLVDDEPNILLSLGRFFEREGWEVFRAESGEQGIALHEARRPDLVLLDLNLPGISGMEVLEVLAKRDATVVLLTGHGDLETAVEAVRLGAENFLSKPVDLPHLRAAAERAVEKTELRRTNRLLATRLAEGRDEGFLGSSPRMREVARQLRLLAASDDAVLLLGESGTGKGWAAQMLHAHGRRATAPLVEVDCAGMSAGALELALFGHEAGALAGARTMQRGLFEAADGGTLFLDEIGDLAPELQPKLLTALERRSFYRLGGTREIHVDVRLIAATRRKLEAGVGTGRFREDLFYRLNMLPLVLPPLRERAREDVLELTHRLLGTLRTAHPGGPARLAARTQDLLLAYPWPGNVRELRDGLEQALGLAAGSEEIRPEHLPLEIRSAKLPPHPPREGHGIMRLEEVEQRHIERTLLLFDGNRTRAARALGISRATLHNKIRALGLETVGRE